MLYKRWWKLKIMLTQWCSYRKVELFKRLLKITVLAYIYQLAKSHDFVIGGSKDVFTNAPCLMY